MKSWEMAKKQGPEKARISLDRKFKGMRTLVLENSVLKVSILLDKGSDIFELVYKPLNIDLMWHTFKGYRNPRDYTLRGDSPGDPFHEFYGGGWNDIFPNYGPQSSNRGASFVEHGESPLLPWECSDAEVAEGTATARLSLELMSYPLRAEKTISLDGSTPLLTISEDLVNMSEQQLELSWAQHIAYGGPFVDDHLRIEIPPARAHTHTFPVSLARLTQDKDFQWPYGPGLDGGDVDLSKLPPRTTRTQDDFPILGLKPTEYKLYNSRLGFGVQVSWNGDAFPNLWYWLNWGVPDYPYYGTGRTLALEPNTSSSGRGLGEDVRNGSAKVLRPKGKIHADLKLRIFKDKSGL